MRDRRGQMRIIEAMIACAIIIVGIISSVSFSSQFTIQEGSDLEEVGQGVIHVLDNPDLLIRILQNDTNWESNLKTLLSTVLPPNTLYTLTLTSQLRDEQIANITNMAGQDPSNPDAVSLTHIVTISLPVTKVEATQLDTMLIMDRSGSMSERMPGDPNSKIYYAKQAAKTFVDKMNSTKDRIGLASYSDSGRLDQALTSNFILVKNKIDSLTASGWTNMYDGIAKANAEFAAHNRTAAKCVMIFLTDGLANRPCHHDPRHDYDLCPEAASYARDEAAKARSRGVRIYTIGLGNSTQSFDESLLKEIQTNGYYYAPSAQMLNEIYLAIAEDLNYFAADYDIVTIVITLVKGA